MHKAKVMRGVEKKFKAAEALAKRIFDAKERRMDDAKKPNRKVELTTMWNKVCRRLENIIDLQEAQLFAAWTSIKAQDATALVHASHVRVLQLEIARLRRALR